MYSFSSVNIMKFKGHGVAPLNSAVNFLSLFQHNAHMFWKLKEQKHCGKSHSGCVYINWPIVNNQVWGRKWARNRWKKNSTAISYTDFVFINILQSTRTEEERGWFEKSAATFCLQSVVLWDQDANKRCPFFPSHDQFFSNCSAKTGEGWRNKVSSEILRLSSSEVDCIVCCDFPAFLS